MWTVRGWSVDGTRTGGASQSWEAGSAPHSSVEPSIFNFRNSRPITLPQ